jgi:hypothetical protein
VEMELQNLDGLFQLMYFCFNQTLLFYSV